MQSENAVGFHGASGEREVLAVGRSPDPAQHLANGSVGFPVQDQPHRAHFVGADEIHNGTFEIRIFELAVGDQDFSLRQFVVGP